MTLLLLRRAAWSKLLLGGLAALVVLLATSSAHAYAWMIRHEYTACAQCHADPSGGSLLTPYGRAQGEILLRTQYTKRGEDEEPGNIGNFMFGAFDLPEALLLGADARGMQLQSKTTLPDPIPNPPKISRFILMQADLVGQLTVDRFRANGSVGYAYDGALGASLTRGQDTTGRAVSRVHWVGMDLGADKEFLLRAGRMNLPFGIRQIEHTMFVRTATRTDIDAAQDHGVAISYNGAGLRAELMGIAGNFQIRPDAYRERGYAGYAEYAPYEKLAVGASSLIVHADAGLSEPVAAAPVWRHAHGLFGRFTPLKQLVLLAESDLLLVSQPPSFANSHRTQFGSANMLQADVEPIQGVHVILAGELYDQELARARPTWEWWAGAQWFFAPHADVRVDAVYTATPISSTQSAGTTSLLAQLHVYL
jgi:hypothetical protein